MKKISLPVRAAIGKLPVGASVKIGRAGLLAKKHSPQVLFAAGVVGVVATVVVACRATLKLNEIIDETNDKLGKVEALLDAEVEDYSEEDAKKDQLTVRSQLVLQTIKLYGPAVLIGAASVAALTGSHVILNRRYAGVAAAYKILEKGFAEYRERVIKELGPEKDEEFLYDMKTIEVTEGKGENKKTRKIKIPGGVSQYGRIFEATNRHWSKEPHANQFFVMCQQTFANDLLNTRGHVLLNEVYDMLGYERTPEGCVVGWLKSGTPGSKDGYISFGVFDGDVFSAKRFVDGDERSVILDFNVDGIVYDRI